MIDKGQLWRYFEFAFEYSNVIACVITCETIDALKLAHSSFSELQRDSQYHLELVVGHLLSLLMNFVSEVSGSFVENI